MGAPLLDLPLVSPSEGLWHQETEAVRVTGTHVVLTGRISQPLSRASLLTTVFDSWINSPPRSKEPKLLKGCACFTLPPIKIYNTKYNISVKVIYFAKYPWQPTWPILKNALYLSVNVFCMEVLIWDTIFMSPTGDGLVILQWSSEPQKICEFIWMILHADSNAMMTSKGIKWCRIAKHESHSQQPLVNFKIIWLLSMFLMGRGAFDKVVLTVDSR